MKKQTSSLVSLDQHIAAQAPIVDTKPASHALSQKQQAALQAPVVATPKMVPFRIIDDVRPKSGTLLFSFTHAWFELTGLLDGKAVDRKQAIKLAGSTMVGYHTKLGNFELRQDGLALTVHGINKFKGREPSKGGKEKYDPKAVEAYKAILTHGKMDGEYVKNQSFIVAM